MKKVKNLIFQLWDLRSRSIVHEFKGHTEAIDCCMFLPYCGGKLLATASRDCSVKIWDRDSKGKKKLHIPQLTSK